MDKVYLTNKDEKAFYAVVAPYQNSNVFNKLGYCFKMHHQLTGQTMWVTSSKLLGEQEKSQKKKLSAERCIPRKGKKVISELDVAKLHTTDSGIAFINCDADDQEKNYLKFGSYETDLPDEAFAYVFDGKKVTALKFVKTGDGAVTYTFKDSPSSDKASKHFKILEAVGSPIIIAAYQPERNQVAGILNIEADGTLKPVFFELSTFDLDQKSPSKGNYEKSPSEDQKSPSEGNYEKSPIEESNGDKTDSLTQASKDQKSPSEGNYEKSPSEESNGDKTDSLTQASKDQKSPSEVNYEKSPIEESNGDKTDSPTQASKESANGDEKDSPIAAFKGSALLPASKCIKNKELQNSPNTYTLKQKLKIRLDPETFRGNDYRQLAESFGYDCATIRYLGLSPTKKSPTVTILEDKSCCTIGVLRGKLINMERNDAVKIIDKYIKDQGCNCENCGSLR